MADLCPLGAIPQLELSSGIPSVGGLLFFYVAGSVNTKQTTYTTSSGGVANTNPVVLDALGMPTGGLGIWLTHGALYKIVYAPAGDTDPPTSPIWTIDNVSGIATPVSLDQWVASGLTPTYVNATSFTLAGDQTSAFEVGRRLKTTISAGTGYNTISASAFAAGTTTVTVTGTALDAGLSAVSYGLMTSSNTSFPEAMNLTENRYVAAGSQSTATTPDYAFRAQRAVTLTGTPVGRGASAFADATTYTGAGIADHINSYQVAQGSLTNSGIIDRYTGYFAIQDFSGSAAVTMASMFHAESPTGAGVITNLYGVYIAELTRAVANDKYAVYTAGATASWFNGTLNSGTSMIVAKNGSDTPGSGPFHGLRNVAANQLWHLQLSAANNLAVWNFNATYDNRFTFDRTGFKLIAGAAPGAPADNDVWMTAAGMFYRQGGVTVGPLA